MQPASSPASLPLRPAQSPSPERLPCSGLPLCPHLNHRKCPPEYEIASEYIDLEYVNITELPEDYSLELTPAEELPK